MASTTGTCSAIGDGKSRLSVAFPLYYCIFPYANGDSGAEKCFLWGCILSMILTLMAVGTLVSLLLLCRSHIIVDGSKTTRLIYYLTVVSCILFLVVKTINGDPRLYAAVEMLEGYVSITVAFVLASIWCRIYEKAEYVRRFVVPVFGVVVTAIFVVYVLGALGTFAQGGSSQAAGNRTSTVPTSGSVILNCHDNTWIIFSILESVLVTFSRFASCGIVKKLQEMVVSEDYRRRKTKQVWVIAVIYSVSVYTTLAFSLYSRGGIESQGPCARWTSEIVETQTIEKALPQMLGSILMYILDTFVPMWSVVILIRHLFPSGTSSAARRTSSWSGDEYIGRESLMPPGVGDQEIGGGLKLNIDDLLGSSDIGVRTSMTGGLN